MMVDEDVPPSPLFLLLLFLLLPLPLPFLGMMSFSSFLDKMTRMTETAPSQMKPFLWFFLCCRWGCQCRGRQ